MKQYSCPYKGDMCFSYGNCEDCEWSKVMEKNKRYRKTIKELNTKNAELQKQVDELKERNYWLESNHEYECERAYFEGLEKGKTYGT